MSRKSAEQTGVLVRLPPDVAAYFRQQAKANGCKVGDYLARWIVRHLRGW